MLLLEELNKTNEVKFGLTIYSYFDVSMIMFIIIKKNKCLKKSHTKLNEKILLIKDYVLSNVVNSM